MSALSRHSQGHTWYQVGGSHQRTGAIVPAFGGFSLDNPDSRFFPNRVSPEVELANFCSSYIGQLASHIRSQPTHIHYWVFGYSGYLQIQYPCESCRQRRVNCACNVILNALFAEKESLRVQSFDKDAQFNLNVQGDFILRQVPKYNRQRLFKVDRLREFHHDSHPIRSVCVVFQTRGAGEVSTDDRTTLQSILEETTMTDDQTVQPPGE